MNTKITITLNGSVAPKQRFQLGYKFENVGDTITFTIPSTYLTNYHYLVVQRTTRTETEIENDTTPAAMIFPLTMVSGHPTFTISAPVTYYPGDYSIVFIATQYTVSNGNIQEAHRVFVSNEFTGYVIDNFLHDSVELQSQWASIDPNFQIYYNKLSTLYDTMEAYRANDYYRGRYYKPAMNSDGVLSWTIESGTPTTVPTSKNLTGPQGVQGDYFLPSYNSVDHVISWTRTSHSGTGTPSSIQLYPMITSATTTYLDANLSSVLDTKVAAAINSKFQWIWDAATDSFYIYTNGYTPEE